MASTAINGIDDPTQSIYKRKPPAPPPIADPQAMAGAPGATPPAAPDGPSPFTTLPAVQGVAGAASPLPNESGAEAAGRYTRAGANLIQVPGQMIGAGLGNAIGTSLSATADAGAGVLSGIFGRRPPAPLTSAAAVTPQTTAPNGATTPTSLPGAPVPSVPSYTPQVNMAADANAAGDAMKSNVPGTAVINGRIVSPEEIASRAAAPTGALDPNSTYNRAVAENSAHVAGLNQQSATNSAIEASRASAGDTARNFNANLARAGDPFDPIGRQIIAARHDFESAGDIKSRMAAGAVLKTLLGGLAQGGGAEAAANAGANQEGVRATSGLENTQQTQQGEFARLVQGQNAPTPEVDQDGNYRIRTGGTTAPITGADGKPASAPYVNRNQEMLARFGGGLGTAAGNGQVDPATVQEYFRSASAGAAQGQQPGAKAPAAATPDAAQIALLKSMTATPGASRDKAIEQFEQAFGKGSASQHVGK